MLYHPNEQLFKLQCNIFSPLLTAAFQAPLLLLLHHLRQEDDVVKGPVINWDKLNGAQVTAAIFAANLEEEGDHYEGDMILPEGSTKVTTNNPSRRWPNRVVPYTIEGSYSK